MVANALWSASNLPAYLRFRSSLRFPQAAQERKLRAYLEGNTNTAFGKAHCFDTIRTYEEFARRVPLADYESLEPWIARIRRGEVNVLTAQPATHLVPTSGSSGARKLIPFTDGLQREFNAAIGPWLVDLQRQEPKLIGGPAYWSVTPALKKAPTERSAVPIGFDADTAYLGGARQCLAEAVMAVPSAVQSAESLDAFRYETLFHLLRCRELRLISVWHPSFLTLLLGALAAYWEDLLAEIAQGRNRSMVAMPRRAKELRGIGCDEPAMLWPVLRVVSCWGNGNAENAIAQLRRKFPDRLIQPKGLLATEAVVTIPFSGLHPLAVNSHFFEFLDAESQLHLAQDLQAGQDYAVVVTTGSGLWRYRLGDQVRVTGFLGQTPCLQFLGRSGNISDRFGEKLSEAFVAQVIQEALANQPVPSFAFLAPDEDASGCRYTLYAEGNIQSEIASRLDALLRRNPHYAWCRDLGQLQEPRLFRIKDGGYEAFVTRECSTGKRLGDIKPCSLSNRTGWGRCFVEIQD